MDASGIALVPFEIVLGIVLVKRDHFAISPNLGKDGRRADALVQSVTFNDRYHLTRQPRRAIPVDPCLTGRVT